MAETKRMPTEMEVQALLRNAARQAADDAEIGDYALSADGRFGPLLALMIGGLCIVVLLVVQEPMRSWPGMVAAIAWITTMAQGVEIGRLKRVTKALARAAGRAPLPRAPSPPVADAPRP